MDIERDFILIKGGMGIGKSFMIKSMINHLN